MEHQEGETEHSRRNEMPALSAKETDGQAPRCRLSPSERGDDEKQGGQSAPAVAAAEDGQVNYARPDAAVCYVGRSSWKSSQYAPAGNHGAASASSSSGCPQAVLAPAPAPAPAPPTPLWILDTGASQCLTGDPNILQGLHSVDVCRIVDIFGGEMRSDSCGRAFGNVKHSGIRYFPGAAVSVISSGCLTMMGCELKVNRDTITVTKGGILVGRGRLLGNGTWSLDYLNDARLDSSCDACPARPRPHAHASS